MPLHQRADLSLFTLADSAPLPEARVYEDDEKMSDTILALDQFFEPAVRDMILKASSPLQDRRLTYFNPVLIHRTV